MKPRKSLPSFVLFIILIASSFRTLVSADVSLASCNNCITVRILTHASGSWTPTYGKNLCNAETHADGTVGQLAIIRSTAVRDLIQPQLTVNSYVGGADDAVEGTWRWFDTQEHFFTCTGVGVGTVPQFAWAIWNGGEPNEYGTGEDYLELATGGRLNDIVGGGTRTVCMFFHKMIRILRSPAVATSKMSSYGVWTGQPLYEVQVYATHLDHNAANAKCRLDSRTDPITGKTVSGQLAILRSGAQASTLYGLVFGNSDIPFHTSEAGFGVWLGATRTDGAAKTSGYDIAVMSSTSDNFFVNGACDGMHYCNFTAASVAASWVTLSSLAMKVDGSDPTFMMQDRAYTMPYACSYEYSLVASVNTSTSSSIYDTLDDTLQNSFASAELAKFVSVGDHVTWPTARARCEAITMANKVGESVAGELATIFSEECNNAIEALAEAAGYKDRATNDTFGLWVGASTDLPQTLHTSSNCDLRWNASSAFQAVSAPTVATCTGSSSACAASGVYCNFTSATLAGSWPQHESRGLVLGIKQTPSVSWVTMPVTQALPYVCSFRYTLRQNITSFLAAELHTTPRTFAGAHQFCGTRLVGVVGNKKAGKLSNYFSKTGWGALVRFISRSSANDNPVWVGDKHPTDASKCRAMFPRTLASIYLDCAATYLPHICYFETGKPTSKTTSKSKYTMSLSESPTAAKSATSSITVAESQSLTVSDTTSVTRDETASVSTTQSNTASTSRSDSPSIVRTASNTNSDTKSPTSDITLSRSDLSLTGSETHHATDSDSHTLILSESDSGNISVSATRTGDTASAERTATNESSPSLTAELSSSNSSVESYSINFTYTLSRETATVSESHTILRIVKPVKAVTLSDQIGTAAMAIGLANPAVAASMNRMKSATVLSNCGQGTDLEEVPGRFQSALQLAIGDSELRWARGLILGNGILMIMIIAANFVIGAGLGFIFLKRNWREGALRLRFPSLVMLPFLIYHLPTAEAVMIIFLYPYNGRDVVASFFGGTFLLCVPVLFAYEIARRLRYRQCSLVPVNQNTKEKKETRRRWRKVFGVTLVKAFHWLLAFRCEWRDTDVIRYERDLEKRKAKGDRAARRELRKFQAEKNNENARYPFFGRWGEFFDDVKFEYFFLCDFVVATLQGFCSGAAARETTRTICFVSLTTALVSSLVHLVVVIKFAPGISRLFQGYLSLSSSVTFVAFLLAYIKFIMRDQFDYDDAAETVGLIQAVIGLMISIVSLGEFFDFIHGLLSSLFFNKVAEDSDSEEEFHDLLEKETTAMIAIEADEDRKEAQQEPQHDEEAEQRMQEAAFAEEMMENAKKLLLAQAANGGEKRDDDDDDWSGLDAREKAFRLVRLLAPDDPVFDVLKTAAQKQQDKEKKKAEEEKKKRKEEERERQAEERRRKLEELENSTTRAPPSPGMDLHFDSDLDTDDDEAELDEAAAQLQMEGTMSTKNVRFDSKQQHPSDATKKKSTSTAPAPITNNKKIHLDFDSDLEDEANTLIDPVLEAQIRRDLENASPHVVITTAAPNSRTATAATTAPTTTSSAFTNRHPQNSMSFSDDAERMEADVRSLLGNNNSNNKNSNNNDQSPIGDGIDRNFDEFGAESKTAEAIEAALEDGYKRGFFVNDDFGNDFDDDDVFDEPREVIQFSNPFSSKSGVGAGGDGSDADMMAKLADL